MHDGDVGVSVNGLGYVAYQAARGQDAEVPAVCGRGLTAGGVTNTPNTGVIVGVSDSSCTNAGCLTLDASGDPDGADTTACTGRSGAKRLILPTDVGYADNGGPPVNGNFTVNCGNKVGRYLYVQLVGLHRQLWVGEIMAEFTAAPQRPRRKRPHPHPPRRARREPSTRAATSAWTARASRPARARTRRSARAVSTATPKKVATRGRASRAGLARCAAMA